MPRDSEMQTQAVETRRLKALIDELREIDRRSVRPLRELMLGQRDAMNILMKLDLRAQVLRDELRNRVDAHEAATGEAEQPT